jgi:hypothetical protein
MRVIIPEPSFWEPESPFLYQGPVELWQDGQRCDQVQITRGLRVIQLGPRGLRLNGRLFTIRGVACKQCSEEEASQLHQAGTNTLLAPVMPETAALWDMADQFGFLMLGRIAAREQLSQAQALAGHPSSLGWLLDPDLLQIPPFDQAPSLATDVLPGYEPGERSFVGIELKRTPAPGSVPRRISFVACPEELAPALDEREDVPGPKIILGKQGLVTDASDGEAASPAGVLGWIDAKSTGTNRQAP